MCTSNSLSSCAILALALGVSGGVTRVVDTRPDGADFEEFPDFTDSGMLERTDTLPANDEGGREEGGGKE